MKKIKTITYLVLSLLCCFSQHHLKAQGCNPDNIGPTLACNAITVFDVLPNDQLTISALDVLDAAIDNCDDFADLEFFITSNVSTGIPFTTPTVTFPIDTTGFITFEVLGYDQSGNSTICWGSIYVNQLSAGCPTDNEPPTFNCNSIVNVSTPIGQDFAIHENMILEGFGIDNCTSSGDIEYFLTADPNLTSPPTTDTVYFPSTSSDTVSVYLWGVDEAGNATSCESEIALFPGGPPCANDVTPPVAVCDAFAVATGVPGVDIFIPATTLDDGSNDNCTPPNLLEYFVTLDGSLSAPPTTDTLFFPAGTNDTVLAYMWVVDASGNANVCAVEVMVKSLQYVSGNVFLDDNQNCVFDSTENGLIGFSVRYTLDQGLSYTTINNSSGGYYNFGIPTNTSATEVTVEVILPNGISTSCLSSQTLPLPLSIGGDLIDFPLQLASNCDNMKVDIAANNLRRCTTNTYFTLYCNFSSYDIDNVEMELTLPTDMSITSSVHPYTSLGNNSYLFEIGTVPAGICNVIPMSIFLDCNTPIGATRCIDATISPNNCGDSLNWNGSNLLVTGECDELNDLVRFTITNQSSQPMQMQRTASVVEDVVMYMTAPVQLGAGASDVLEFAANGSTWRVEIPQENGHPSMSIPSAMIEGCGGYGSTGIVNQFSTPDVDPYFSMECMEVIASYDPNDKQAFPIGVSSEHFIEPNTSIEYKIRFQNTGNDTAFVVRLEDQLSTHLDWSTIQAGASSHPYRMELREGGKLIFHFENILLPDSTTNLEASQGFINFRVHQLQDNPIGTLIENTADIYFDFNEAIITNTVFHTVGTNFITTSTIKTVVPDLNLTVAPNPFSNFTIFTLNGIEIQKGQFELYDLTGRLIKEENFTNNQYKLQRDGLPSGAYIFTFKNVNGLLANGKLIVN